MSAFNERDKSKPAEEQGLFRKFEVNRLDGSDQPGGRHEGCRYFVLDMDHDPHAAAALAAYAEACKDTHPQLSVDLANEFGVDIRIAAGHFVMSKGGAWTQVDKTYADGATILYHAKGWPGK